MAVKFFKCQTCSNVAVKMVDSTVPMFCCGKKMEELIPNTVDASGEKHVPVVTRKGNIVEVKVGSVEHPMTNEHYIQWICLQTKLGNQRKMLKPTDKPEAKFMIFEDDEIEAVYEYCNLHSLWKNEG